MSNKVARSRFIVSSLIQHTEFYQQLLNRVSSFHELGSKLIYEAETAYSFRQTDRVEELGLILSNFPIKEYKLIGQYYLGWCAYRSGNDARPIFEKTIEETKTYKAKGLISLAAVEANNGDYAAELSLYTEAAKYADNYSTLLTSLRAIAVVKAKEGYHQQALDDLQRIAPLIHHASPKAYYDYLNSLAVELGEVGRKYEARNICRVVLASPFAFAYPEWQATAEDLRGSSRSFTAICPSPVRAGKVLSMPLPERGGSVQFDYPARVLNYLDWKNKMVKKSNGDHKDKTSSEGKTEKELFFELTEIISKRQFDSEQLYKLIDFADKISSKPDPEPQKD